MRFEFATATHIIFGNGTIRDAAPLAAQMGKRAFIVTGRTVERAEPLLQQLNKQAVECITFSVSGEPTTMLVKAGIAQTRQAKCDIVIGIGGGSVIDTAKVIAAMLTNNGELEDYLEVVGLGKPIVKNPAPFIAIPTTAGTGAEVTRNAVLGVPQYGSKVSMRSSLMLARLAVVDPELTYSMPPALTASTGLDALTQLIEPFICNKANPLIDGVCREGLIRVGRSLLRAYENGGDKSAREDMALASHFSGLALANAGLGAVHGLAGPLGGMISAPHGLICARLLPYVIEANVKALQSRERGSPALSRYEQIAQFLTGKATARAADLVGWVQNLCVKTKIPSLAEFGLREQDFPAAIEKAKKSSSMKTNPIALTDDELMGILKNALIQ
jgi:alcohol dehydrogenase class IV